jgi:hypothetical protein
VGQCASDNGCQNQACLEANCSVELYSCYTGAGTCGQLFACAQMTRTASPTATTRAQI